MNARIRRIPAAARSAIARFRSTPFVVKGRFLWGIRRAVLPYIRIPICVRSFAGARFYLGADPVDDLILEDTLTTFVKLYFPEGVFGNDEAFLALDVGAHHGIPAVELLRRYPAATMVAVEPNPLSAEYLRRNCAGNSLLSRVTIVEAGIGKADTDGLLIPGGRSWGDSTVLAEPKTQSPPGSIGVKLCTLESILRGQKPDFVKCNAEGAEFELIPQLLALGIRPRIIVLLVHQECGDVDKLLSSVGEAGYEMTHVLSGRNRPRVLCRLRG